MFFVNKFFAQTDEIVQLVDQELGCDRRLTISRPYFSNKPRIYISQFVSVVMEFTYLILLQ